MRSSLRKWFLGWLRGGPHFIIGDPAAPYLKRWHVLPRNRWLNVYLHHILRSDDDRALHDHPWWFVSAILWGGYFEHVGDGWSQTWDGSWRWNNVRRVWRRMLSVRLCRTGLSHRIELPQGRTAWTLVVTGPVAREWGFYCPKRWVRWQDFVDATNTGNIGKGCGD